MPQSVLITGCSAGGIGSALVEEFQSRGLHVYATARSKAKMAHLEKLPNVTLLELDVASQASIDSAVGVVQKSTGTLDILINNAGQSQISPALDSSIDEAKRMFDVNLWGVVAMTQAFAPVLIAAKGTIVNVCSIAGYLNSPWMSLYGASKAATMSYSEALRLELEPFGVKVVSLVAGAVKTNLLCHSNITLPAGSMYNKAIKEIQLRGQGEDVSKHSTPTEFARAVVGDVLGGGHGPVWRGMHASSVRYLSAILPVWAIDWILRAGTGLEHLP